MRISYRCLKDERSLPIAERTHWDVLYGKERIGTISAEDDISANRSHSIRVWKARLNKGFNAFEFPHVDEEDNDITTEPYIVTNDVAEVDHNLELHNPQLLTMKEARVWISNTFKNNT